MGCNIRAVANDKQEPGERLNALEREREREYREAVGERGGMMAEGGKKRGGLFKNEGEGGVGG